MALWFRHLMTDWFSVRQPALREVPFVLTLPDHNRIVITATNFKAEQFNIKPGMAAADAKAIVPDIKIMDDQPGKALKLLNALGEWCIRYTPLIAIDAPDGLLFDISGCAHLWGDERGYLKEIVRRLQSKGYDVRGAIADTAGAAWAVARFGRVSPIVEVGMQVDALLPLAPAALRLEQQALDRFKKLGFYTISNFISLKRSALRRRFGDAFLLRLDQALGNADEPLQYIHPIAPYQERLPSMEPIRTATGIELAIKTLLNGLCKRLYDEGMGLRTAILKCYRVDGKIISVDIGTNQPSHAAGHLFKLFELKISTIEPDLGIELFTLEAPKVEEVTPEQDALWTVEAGGLDQNSLVELLDKLATKIGSKNIRRYLPQESYYPERSIKRALSLSEKPASNWRNDSARPSLLLRRPEQVMVMHEVPDNPPMVFTYKNERHTIVRADDAERVEPEWWKRDRPHRDYYVIEDEQGRRYWVFRSGSEKDASWYIHGFFA